MSDQILHSGRFIADEAVGPWVAQKRLAVIAETCGMTVIQAEAFRLLADRARAPEEALVDLKLPRSRCLAVVERAAAKLKAHLNMASRERAMKKEVLSLIRNKGEGGSRALCGILPYLDMAFPDQSKRPGDPCDYQEVRTSSTLLAPGDWQQQFVPDAEGPKQEGGRACGRWKPIGVLQSNPVTLLSEMARGLAAGDVTI